MAAIVWMLLSMLLDLVACVTLGFVVAQQALALDLGMVWALLAGGSTVYVLFNLLWVVVPGVQRSHVTITGFARAWMDRQRRTESKDEGDPNDLESGGRRIRNKIGFKWVPRDHEMGKPKSPEQAEPQVGPRCPRCRRPSSAEETYCQSCHDEVTRNAKPLGDEPPTMVP